MIGNSLSKLAVLGALMVALAGIALGTSTRSADAAAPATLTVSASATCGGAITATAVVRDAVGQPAVGYTVAFTTANGGGGAGVTNAAGVATAVLSMPGIGSNVQVTAVSGTAFGSTIVSVNCGPIGACGLVYCGSVCPAYGCVAPINCNYAPGVALPGNIYYSQIYQYSNNCGGYAGYPGYGAPGYVAPVVNGCYAYNCAPGYNLSPCYGVCYGQVAAKINLAANPSILTCGGAGSISANVTDAFGVPVANGTAVSFSTSLGTISPSASTNGGNTVASLQTASGTSGVALVTVKAGNAAATTTIQVNCVVAAPQNVVVYQPAPGQTAPQVIYKPGPPQQQPQRPVVVVTQPPYAPPFAPPRTGNAGLLNDLYDNDDAANAALVDAFQHGQDVVTDQSAIDATPDMNVDVDASATDNVVVYDLDFAASLVDGNLIGDDAANAALALDLSSVTDHGTTDFGRS